MSRRIISLLLCVFLYFCNGYSQRWKLSRYEVHFGLGTTNIFGKIGGSADKNNLYGLKDIKIGDTGPSFYLAARYRFSEASAFKLNLIYGIGHGSDAGSINATRGYSYKTKLFEPSIQYEYFFLRQERKYRPFNLFNRRGMINNFSLLSAYGFVGAGGLFFSPQLTLNQSFYNAFNTPIKREFISGYSTISAVVSLGVGIDYSINNLWSVGFELGRRFTFTNYLEGINTLYSKSKDIYYFSVLHAIYKLPTDRRGIPIIFSRRKY